MSYDFSTQTTEFIPCKHDFSLEVVTDLMNDRRYHIVAFIMKALKMKVTIMIPPAIYYSVDLIFLKKEISV